MIFSRIIRGLKGEPGDDGAKGPTGEAPDQVIGRCSLAE